MFRSPIRFGPCSGRVRSIMRNCCFGTLLLLATGGQGFAQSNVVVIRPKMPAANYEGAATSISIVPFQRSVVIVQPELKRASHQRAMKTGAIAAYAVRS